MTLAKLIRQLGTLYDKLGNVDVVVGKDRLELLAVAVDEAVKPWDGGDTVVVLNVGK